MSSYKAVGFYPTHSSETRLHSFSTVGQLRVVENYYRRFRYDRLIVALSLMDRSSRFSDTKMEANMSVKLMLMFFVMFLGALSAHAQSLVEEVGDEKEPKLRVELLQLVRDDQNVRAEFDQYRKRHG